MKTQIIFTILAVFIFFLQIHADAQTKNLHDDIYKYEIALDITPFFQKTNFWEANFKLFNFKNNLLKGAYRLGIDLSYNYLTFPDTKGKGKNHHINNGLSVGYEHYIALKDSKFYFGADIAGYLTLQKHDPVDVNDFQNITYAIIPFIGVRKQVIKCLAFSFEAGWNNSIMYYKNLDTELPDYTTTKSVSYQTFFDIPYSFTINYRF